MLYLAEKPSRMEPKMTAQVGDLKNNIKILQNEMRHYKFQEEPDFNGIAKGKPQAYLPLYHHVFTSYNSYFTAEVTELLDEGLYGKSDMRFMEAVYRVLRDLFNYKPAMTKDQFFSTGNFIERKVMMAADILRMVREHCRYMGPFKLTNPNNKVSSVIDSRRSSKVSTQPSISDVVLQEPYNDTSNTSVSRKTSQHQKLSPRPVSANSRSQKDEIQPQKPSGTLRPKSAASGNMEARVAEVKVVDVIARTPDQSMSEPNAPREHTDAMETILNKVRDLPTQLCNFMQAVEIRLQKMEERLQSVEIGGTHPELQDEIKQQWDTLKSRFILLENRVYMIEGKLQQKAAMPTLTPPISPPPTMNHPYITMESGEPKKENKEDIFASPLIRTFSPIRREGFVFSNDNFNSFTEGLNRYSSTPTNLSSNNNNTMLPQADHGVADLSFHNLDTSTQQQVHRITGLLHDTKCLLPTQGGPSGS